MIKVDKVSEAKGHEIEIPKAFKNIKPREIMSDQEASDFIAKEFEKAHDEAELDTYSKLLSEAFNRCEDEIIIDFEINEKIKSILEKFNDENWNNLDTSERTKLIKEFVKAVGKELGVEKIPEVVLSNDDDNAYGFYDQFKNLISINDKFTNNPVEVANTVAHELRHAYQHYRAEILESWEDALFKINYDNYISPIQLPNGGWLFFTDYQDQYVEVDARAFANIFTEAMR